MQPCKYEAIGKKQTTLAIKPGYAVHLNEENAKVDLWTDAKLENPGFATTFNLPPGAVDIKVDAGKISRLAIKPDIKNYNAQLEILPLENGAFKFAVFRDLEQIKSNLKIEYASATNEGKITVSPKFEYKGIKVDGQFSFNGIKQNQPPVIVEHLKAYCKNFALCSCYNLKAEEVRGAVFLNLKKAKAGTLLHFGKGLAFKEADIFAKTKIHGLKIGTIASIMAKKYTVNLESKCKKCKAEFGATASYTANATTFAAGLQLPVKCAGLKFVVNGQKAEKFNAGLNAQLNFPIKAVGAATAGISIANLCEPKQCGYNFEITLKQ
jgi:hypothetical protein